MADYLMIKDETPIAMMTWGQFRKGIEQELLLLHSTKVESQIMTIEEVAGLTGYKINTIYAFCSQNTIPYHKPKHGGKKNVFIRAEVEEWLQGKRITTTEESVKNRMGSLQRVERN